MLARGFNDPSSGSIDNGGDPAGLSVKAVLCCHVSPLIIRILVFLRHTDPACFLPGALVCVAPFMHSATFGIAAAAVSLCSRIKKAGKELLNYRKLKTQVPPGGLTEAIPVRRKWHHEYFQPIRSPLFSHSVGHPFRHELTISHNILPMV
jgi:hypothetical protein